MLTLHADKKMRTTRIAVMWLFCDNGDIFCGQSSPDALNSEDVGILIDTVFQMGCACKKKPSTAGATQLHDQGHAG